MNSGDLSHKPYGNSGLNCNDYMNRIRGIEAFRVFINRWRRATSSYQHKCNFETVQNITTMAQNRSVTHKNKTLFIVKINKSKMYKIKSNYVKKTSSIFVKANSIH